MILGILLGLGLIVLLTTGALSRTILIDLPTPIFISLFSNPIAILFIEYLGESIGTIMSLIMFLVAIIFLPASFLAGFLSGNRKKGLISGIIITIIVFQFLFISPLKIILSRNILGLNLSGWFLSFSPLIFFLTLSVSYTAGYIAERLRLYPFPEPEKKKGKLEKILKSIKEKIGL